MMLLTTGSSCPHCHKQNLDNMTFMMPYCSRCIAKAGGYMNKDEGLNPSIGCGFSRTHEPEHEAHAPTPVTDPFTSSFSETKLDNTD